MSRNQFLWSFLAILSLTTTSFANNAVNANSLKTIAQTAGAPGMQAGSLHKVNLNEASAKELIKVKGLNAARVRAIVAYRKKHGGFKTTEELMNVKGFKRVKLTTRKAIEEQLTV